MPNGPPENPGDDFDYLFDEPDPARLTRPGGVTQASDLIEALRKNIDLRTLFDDNPRLNEYHVINALNLTNDRERRVTGSTRSRLSEVLKERGPETGIGQAAARMREKIAAANLPEYLECFDHEINEIVEKLLTNKKNNGPDMQAASQAMHLLEAVPVTPSAQVKESAKKIFALFVKTHPDDVQSFIRVFGLDMASVREEVIKNFIGSNNELQSVGIHTTVVMRLQEAGVFDRNLQAPDIQEAALEECRVGTMRHEQPARLLEFKAFYGLDDVAFGRSVQTGMLKTFWRKSYPPDEYVRMLTDLGVAETKEDPDVRAEALNAFDTMLLNVSLKEDTAIVRWLHDYFAFTDSELAEYKPRVMSFIETALQGGEIPTVRTLQYLLHIPDTEVHEAALRVLKKSYSAYQPKMAWVDGLLREGIIQPEEVREGRISVIRESIARGSVSMVDDATKLSEGGKPLFGADESVRIAKKSFLDSLQAGRVDTILKLEKVCDLSLVRAEPETRTAALAGIRSRLMGGVPQIKDAETIRDEYGISQPEYIGIAKASALEHITNNWLDSATQIIEKFGFAGLASSPEGKAAGAQGIARILRIRPAEPENSRPIHYPSEKSIAHALEVQRYTGASDTEILPGIREFVLNALPVYGDATLPCFTLIKARFPFAAAEFESAEVQKAAEARIVQLLPEGKIDMAQKHCVIAGIDPARMTSLASQAMISSIFTQHTDAATAVQTQFHLPDDLASHLPLCNERQRYVITLWKCQDVRDLMKFSRNNQDYLRVALDPGHEPALTPEDIPAVKALHLTPREAENLRTLQILDIDKRSKSLQALSADADNDDLLRQLKLTGGDWADQENIMGPYTRAVECFGEGDPAAGHKRVRAFMSRPGLSRHEALVAMDPIIKLQGISGLKPKSFYGQILEQVRMSGEQHDGLTAHHHLNTVAQNLNPDIAGTLEKARTFKGVVRLQTMAKTFSNPRNVFASWSNLKRFYQLSRELERGEGLQRLGDLRAAGKHKLCDFAETLAFHETSDVSIADTMLFVEKPGEFLDSGDGNAPTALQQNKKPSNYTQIPHLGLTAEELRDGLVEGDFDRMQRFRPLEVRYKIPRPGAELPPAGRHERIRAGYAELERRNTGDKRGGGENRKAFAQLNRLLQPLGTDLKTYLAAQGDAPDAALDAMEDVMKKYLPQQFAVETDELIVKVNLKSDPIGILAGNDTECCMKFGTVNGKNNIYMYNPGDAVLTMQLVRKDGKRTIAQSLLTEDMDIGLPIPEVQKQLLTGKPLTEILPDAKLNDALGYMSGDNVQVAPNYKQEPYLSLIRKVFADFTFEYLQRYGDTDNLTKDKVPVGTMYSAAHETGNALNTFSPMVPLSYSDKTGPQVCMVTPEKLVEDRHKTVIEHAKPDNPTLRPIATAGVSHLVPKDTIPTAYLEERIYHDNATLVMHLHNIENGLIGVGANNIRKDKPHLCFKCRDKTGRMTGYMIAYEGVLSNEHAKVGVDSELEGKPAVYIADMAGEGRVAGAALTQEFIAQYSTEYLAKGVMMPIYAETRESTSYRTMLSRLKRSAPKGVLFDLREFPTYKAGKDTMHPIIIVPRKDDTPGATEPEVEHTTAA